MSTERDSVLVQGGEEGEQGEQRPAGMGTGHWMGGVWEEGKREERSRTAARSKPEGRCEGVRVRGRGRGRRLGGCVAPLGEPRASTKAKGLRSNQRPRCADRKKGRRGDVPCVGPRPKSARRRRRRRRMTTEGRRCQSRRAEWVVDGGWKSERGGKGKGGEGKGRWDGRRGCGLVWGTAGRRGGRRNRKGTFAADQASPLLGATLAQVKPGA